MVRRLVVLALLSSAFSVDGFARTRYIAQETQAASGDNVERAAKDQSAPKQKKAKRNSQSDSQRSAVNREGKTVSVTATLIGLEGGTLQGADVGYCLDKDFLLYGRYEKSSMDLNFFGFSIFDSRIDTFALYGKKFFGNSFYTNGGVLVRRTYREFLGDSGFPTSNTNNTSATAKFSQETLDGTIFLAIGNQWQWENFTMGCDWVGIAAPPLVQRVIRNEANFYDLVNEKEQETTLVTPKDVLKTQSLRLLSFYLGFSF